MSHPDPSREYLDDSDLIDPPPEEVEDDGEPLQGDAPDGLQRALDRLAGTTISAEGTDIVAETRLSYVTEAATRLDVIIRLLGELPRPPWVAIAEAREALAALRVLAKHWL